jgi:hypothetical protein
MARLSSSQFMRALPEATRAHLPAELKRFRTVVRSWLCQLYFSAPAFHYEVWNMGERRNRIEIGLHFESRERAENVALLSAFSGRAMVAVKRDLGNAWEAEMWDRGWAKVYETVPYEAFSDATLERTATRLARAITVLEPWRTLFAHETTTRR